MADRIYPSKVIQAHTPLGIDQNNDWRVLRLDKPSDGDWALRVSTPPERVSAWLNSCWNATVGNHAATERWSVTVSSGNRAIIVACFFYVGLPSSGQLASVWVTKNDQRIAQLMVADTTARVDTVANIPMHFWLRTGDVIKGYSYNGGSSDIEMHCNAFILRYDA